jgi:hypothetical protein
MRVPSPPARLGVTPFRMAAYAVNMDVVMAVTGASLPAVQPGIGMSRCSTQSPSVPEVGWSESRSSKSTRRQSCDLAWKGSGEDLLYMWSVMSDEGGYRRRWWSWLAGLRDGLWRLSLVSLLWKALLDQVMPMRSAQPKRMSASVHLGTHQHVNRMGHQGIAALIPVGDIVTTTPRRPTDRSPHCPPSC